MEATSPGSNIGVTNQQEQPAYVEPLDAHPPTQYTPEQNPMMGPSMLMMWMNDNDYAQFGNAPSGNMLSTPYAAPLYHNPTAVMQENVMLNNTMQVPYYTPTFMYYPMVSMGVTPPMQPMLPYYDFSGSQMNGREANS
ncbi:hypothetical protein L1049_002249 [Liquidambar formosana]|uniref:Uncharacterized protein n=1 Tax=Liquidambar formosana TaxID=63359 RepID=A0AAP0NJ43_LIQFO